MKEGIKLKSIQDSFQSYLYVMVFFLVINTCSLEAWAVVKAGDNSPVVFVKNG